MGNEPSDGEPGHVPTSRVRKFASQEEADRGGEPMETIDRAYSGGVVTRTVTRYGNVVQTVEYVDGGVEPPLPDEEATV